MVKNNNKEIKVSVIIPVHNTEEYLRECLDCVEQQTLKDIEIILIDDGSTDGSLDICNEYAQKDDRFFVYHQQNIGAGATRNKGLEFAKGDYISFLDSDDLFEPDMLEKLYLKAIASQSDITFCDFREFGEDNKMRGGLNRKFLPQTDTFYTKDVLSRLFQIVSNVAWCHLYKKELIDKTGIRFDNLKNSNDIFFVTTIAACSYKISYILETLVYHRLHIASTTCKREEGWKDLYTTLLHIEEFLKSFNKFEKLRRTFLNRVLGHLVWQSKYLKEPIKGFWKNLLQKEMFPHFAFDKEEASFYYDLDKYNDYLTLRKSDGSSDKLEHFFYHNHQKIVPIVFSTNENYAPYCGVTIQSIIEHANPNRFYDMYILYTDLSETMRYRLEHISHDNIRITCIDIKTKLKTLDLPEYRHISKETHYRAIIPDLFYGYDKIVYLDSDLVCLTDVSKLFDFQLNDNLIAGVRNYLYPQDAKSLQQNLNLEPLNYINAGVLLMNLKKWKEENISDFYWEYLFKNIELSKFKNQDAINAICQNRILFLEANWNIEWSTRFHPEYQEVIKEYRHANNFPQNLNIVHYTHTPKPWEDKTMELADLWWSYARKSIFYEVILLKNMKG